MSKITFLLLVLVFLAVLGSAALKSYKKTDSQTPDSSKVVSGSSQSTSTSSSTSSDSDSSSDFGDSNDVDSVANWRSYTSKRFNYVIRYPKNWTFKEYSDGAVAFSPTTQSGTRNDQYVYVSYIDRSALLPMQCISLEEYAKMYPYGLFGAVKMLEKMDSDSGLDGYEVLWEYAGEGGKQVEESSIIFDAPGKCGNARIVLNDTGSKTIFSAMASTFKFAASE